MALHYITSNIMQSFQSANDLPSIFAFGVCNYRKFANYEHAYSQLSIIQLTYYFVN